MSERLLTELNGSTTRSRCHVVRHEMPMVPVEQRCCLGASRSEAPRQDVWREIRARRVERIACLAPLEEVERKPPVYARALEDQSVPTPVAHSPIPDWSVPTDLEASWRVATETADALWRVGTAALWRWPRAHRPHGVRGDPCARVSSWGCGGLAGIVTSADEAVDPARTEHVSSQIAEAWRARFAVSAHRAADEFISIAAHVLWERLLPERPSFEMLDERMQDG